MTEAAAVLPDVVEEHLDEAQFLFEQWSAAARSPRFSLALVHKTIEPRLAAHLDGLVVGEKAVADTVLWPALGDDAESPTRAAAAALALLAEPGAVVRDRLIELFRTTPAAPVRDGLARAFKVSARDDLGEPLKLAVYATEDAAAQAALLGVLAARRVDAGPILNALLQRPEPELIAAALAAAGASDRTRLRQAVEARLPHEAPAVRAAALRTSLIWNLQAGLRACATEARAGAPQAMALLAMLGGPRDLALVVEALRSAEHRKNALFALGCSGQVEAVDACLPFVADADKPTAKLATEAIAAITGLALFDEPFVAPAPPEPPADAPLPPLEEDLATDLTPAAHDELPAPNAAEVRKWWSSKRGSMAANQRYLRGMIVSAPSVQLALAEGPLLRTGPLALEIAIRTGGRTQLPALRVGGSAPAIPPDLAMHRTPGWV